VSEQFLNGTSAHYRLLSATVLDGSSGAVFRCQYCSNLLLLLLLLQLLLLLVLLLLLLLLLGRIA